jgi:hypothetical protein
MKIRAQKGFHETPRVMPAHSSPYSSCSAVPAAAGLRGFKAGRGWRGQQELGVCGREPASTSRRRTNPTVPVGSDAPHRNPRRKPKTAVGLLTSCPQKAVSPQELVYRALSASAWARWMRLVRFRWSPRGCFDRSALCASSLSTRDPVGEEGNAMTGEWGCCRPSARLEALNRSKSYMAGSPVNDRDFDGAY